MVAIVGAGDLGGATARALAGTECARRIVLVDAAERVAEGKALDIRQSGPIEGFDTAVDGAATIDAAGGADVVVLADGHGQGEWQGDAGLQMVRRVRSIAPGALIVCAGAAPREMMTLAVREHDVPVSHIVGSAPLAAASAARALAALELDASAADVALMLVGAPPSWAIAWSQATLAGAPLEPRLTPPALARIERRLAASWPHGPFALASAAAATVVAAGARSRRQLPCFTVRRAAGRDVVVALPVTLGPRGVTGVHEPRLSPRERVAYDTLLAG